MLVPHPCQFHTHAGQGSPQDKHPPLQPGASRAASARHTPSHSRTHSRTDFEGGNASGGNAPSGSAACGLSGTAGATAPLAWEVEALR